MLYFGKRMKGASIIDVSGGESDEKCIDVPIQNLERVSKESTTKSKSQDTSSHNEHSPNITRAGRSTEKKTAGVRARSSSGSYSVRSVSPRPKNHICDFPGCTKAYSRPSLLEQHMRSHYGYRPFKCEFEGCNDSFTRKDHLARHMLKHTEEKDKPFHCTVCGKGVNSMQHLKRHEKTHFKSFHCTFEGCNESFHKHQSLKAHIRSVHEQNSSNKCEICGKQFSRPGRLADHMDKHHSDSSKLICDFPNCYKTFRMWSALQLHIKTEHPKLECDICGKKCIGSSGLANHMKMHVDDSLIKLWNCMECGEKFHKKEHAVRHYAEKHPLIELPEALRYEPRLEVKTKHKQSVQEIEYFMKKKEEEKKAKRRRIEPDDEHNTDVANDCDYDTNGKCVKGSHVNKEDLKKENTFNLSDCGMFVAKPTINNFKKHQKNKANTSFDVLDLLVDNVDQRLSCPYSNCHRLFRKQYDLDRHLAWHQRQDKLLDQKVELVLTEIEQAEQNAD